MSNSDVASLEHPQLRSRLRTWIVGLVLLVAAAAAFWTWGRDTAPPPPQRGRFGQGPNQAVPVRTIPVQTGDMEVLIRALGTVTPINTVTVRSRLDGELVRVLFTEGERVKAGQLLAEIDPRPYQVALSQAEGQLQENQARLKNAESDLERFRKLAAEGLITGQQVTTQEALVQQYGGALQANQAQVNNAKLQLAYTRVEAPIDGRLGLRQVDAGNLVRAGDANGLVVIAQMRPISVIFTVPEAELSGVLQGMRGVRRLAVEAWDRADAVRLAQGTLQTVDNQIDTTTGTIRLRALFDNADEQLFPNQFVNVRLRVRTLNDATLIPTAAVQRASFGAFAYVVKDDNTVTVRRIALGPSEADRVAVTNGLAPGEHVVLEGVDELTEGKKVEVIRDAAQRPAGPRAPTAAEGGASSTGSTAAPAGTPAGGPRR